MFFNKDLTKLLFVPAGMEATAILPNTTEAVPVGAFSHSARLTSVRVGESCASYSTENGILYSKDKTTLVALPVGYGDSVVIPESVTTLAPSSFAGCTLKSIVALGAVATIDPAAFTDATKAEATIALPGDLDFDTNKAVWLQAGFTHFQEPSKPGDTTTPEDPQEVSGFVYELLDDYTLSVSWQGDADPDTDLVIPSSANLSGVNYRVSAIASHAFEARSSIKSVVLPSTISSIGDAAFKDCSQLADIALSEGLAVIGASVFEGTALAQVILPKSVSTVKNRAFANNGTLNSIVTLSSVRSIAASAIDGCANVSILTPYQEDGLYAWTLGLSALGNHIEPYRIDLASDPVTLMVGQTGDLLDGAFVELPKNCNLSYSYPAACLSVSSGGNASAKQEGSSEVSASIMLGDLVLSTSYRSAVIISQAEDARILVNELNAPRFTAALPLVDNAPSLEGDAIAPRGTVAENYTSGGCTWDITDGKLTIRPTDGVSGVLASFGDGSDTTSVPWRPVASTITSVDVRPGVKGGASLAFMFEGCSNLINLDLSNLNTNGVGKFDRMFKDCTNLTSLDVSKFDTSAAGNMCSMFYGCESLTSLDLSNFDTAKVGWIQNMFQNCTSLVSLDISSFRVSNVTNMADLFNGCESLTSLDLSNFDTAKTNWMQSLFSGCANLMRLDLSSFNTSQVWRMQFMFQGCNSLTSLDLSNFDTTSVTNMDKMFQGCTALTSLDISNFTAGGSILSTSDMFASTSQLATIKIGASYSLNLPEKEGATNASGATYTGKWIAQSTKLSYDYDTYPKGTADTYAAPVGYILSFDTQGGSTAPSDQIVVVGAKATAVTNPTKTGHTFTDWYQEEACTNKWDITNNTMPANNLTLYAKWSPVEYNVIFDLDGGSGVTTPIKAPYGSTVTKPSANPTKNGYTFDAWYKDAGKTTLWDFAVDTVGMSTTIYAKYTANSYAVHFDSNGGAGDLMDDQTFTYGADPKALSKNTYTKTGYVFAGWATTPTGAVGYTDAQAVSNLAFSGIFNLFAVWTPITYSVHFNSSEGEGAMDTQTGFTYDIPTPLSANQFIKKGHTFAGWATQEAGSIVYLDQALVSTLTPQQGQTVELWAVWTKDTYNVSFESNKGTAVPPTEVLFGELIQRPEDPTRTGYAFVGWYRNKSLNILWDFDVDTVQNETILYAKWTAVVDIDVPLDPKIAIDAQGSVSADEQAIRPFVSRTPQDVLVTSVSCVSTESTIHIFPDRSQWPRIGITLAPENDPSSSIEAKLNKSNTQPSFIIPAATSVTPSEFPISFGLSLPADIQLSYSSETDGVPIAQLSYTFELVS